MSQADIPSAAADGPRSGVSRPTVFERMTIPARHVNAPGGELSVRGMDTMDTVRHDQSGTAYLAYRLACGMPRIQSTGAILIRGEHA
jgi:hypothetical protein